MERPTSSENNQKQTRPVRSRSADIISTVLEDHKPLKELIEVMKDLDKPFEERREAFGTFAPLLVTHAKAEEMSLYEFMKRGQVKELKTEGMEGQTEHTLADQLAEEIKRTTDQEEMSAKIKVLAELVEHHIEEEEGEMFPTVKRELDESTLLKLNDLYLDFVEEIIGEGQDDAPPEKSLPESEQRH